MRGSLRQAKDANKNLRPGVWELRVNLGADPQTGNRRQISQTFKGGKREAQRQLARLVEETSRGRHTGADMTLADLLARYVDNIEPDASPSTLRGYRRRIERRIGPALGRIKIRKLTAADLEDYYRALRRTHAVADVRQDHNIIRAALAYAVRVEWLHDNPASRARPPHVEKRPREAPNVGAVLSIIKAAEQGTGHPNSKPNPDLALFLLLAAATGARRGELCALRWSDFDAATGTLTISRSVLDGLGPGVLIVKDTKTHGVRRVKLDEFTIGMLAARQARSVLAAMSADATIDRDGYVFSHEADRSLPWRPEYATTAFRRIVARLGLTGVRLHDFRHAHASLLMAGGISVAQVSARLGHRDTSTTLNVYVHALEAGDQAAADLIGASLAAGRE